MRNRPDPPEASGSSSARRPIRALLEYLDDIAPFRSAEPWDHVGLQVGDPAARITTVIVTLELTSEALARLRREPAPCLLVTHHPLLFRPVTELRQDDPVGRQILSLTRLGHSLVACHTNWDKAPGGNDDALAEALGLRETRPLMTQDPEMREVVVQVPQDALDRVRDAMIAAGAGKTRRYRGGSFTIAGESRFEAKPGAKPAIGEIGEKVRRSAVSLAMVASGDRIRSVVAAIHSSHPDEEPAISILRLDPESGFEAPGLGRIGSLLKAVPFDTFAEGVSRALRAPGLRVSGAGRDAVRRIATVSGSGHSLIDAAARGGAEVLVTADIGHHDARRAEELGLTLIDAGHRETEEIGVRALTRRLAARFPALSVEFLPTASAFRFRVPPRSEPLWPDEADAP